MIKQGFRHATTLLIRQRCRTISPDSAPQDVVDALGHLARDLIALADDMRADQDSAGWLLAEYERSIDQLPHHFDREAARIAAARVFGGFTKNRPPIEPRDLFLIYVPQDRLPIAAPLAVDLVKRRISVAFTEYEVATAEEFEIAVRHGLTHHRGGAVLWTSTLERAKWDVALPDTHRLRVIREYDNGEIGAELARWVHHLKIRSTAK